jgi:hypothetical protein
VADFVFVDRFTVVQLGARRRIATSSMSESFDAAKSYFHIDDEEKVENPHKITSKKLHKTVHISEQNGLPKGLAQDRIVWFLQTFRLLVKS